MRILEELFYKNIARENAYITNGEELENLIHLVGRADEKLIKILSDEQKLLFENYKLNCKEMTELIESETFVYGFSIGIRIAFESMKDEFC